jgi:hypothetical protein
MRNTGEGKMAANSDEGCLPLLLAACILLVFFDYLGGATQTAACTVLGMQYRDVRQEFALIVQIPIKDWPLATCTCSAADRFRPVGAPVKVTFRRGLVSSHPYECVAEGLK